MPKQQQSPLVCHGHSRPIVDVQFSPVTADGYFLVSASKDGKPMLRNGETGDWIGTFEGHKGAVWSVCLNKPALVALTAAADFTARVWDALSGDELHLFQHNHIVRTCHFTEDSTRFMTGGMEKKIRIFDLNRPDADPHVLEGSESGIRKGLFGLNDSVLFTSCTDHAGIRLWDPRTPPTVLRKLETESPVTDIELSSCSRYLTTCDGNGVTVWDVATFTALKRHSMDFPIEGASYSPGQNKFVMGGADMWVRLLDFDTLEELACHKGHHGPVHCCRFAPGGEAFASGSEDGTIRIWATDPEVEEEEGAGAGATTTTAEANGGTGMVEAVAA